MPSLAREGILAFPAIEAFSVHAQADVNISESWRANDCGDEWWAVEDSNL
ncbi:MAG TPA: hypothetical protein VNL15_02470 [Dehalococcoidia bacterium]|nr:hypothetical protein [Dehalococcoidia bacterium]